MINFNCRNTYGGNDFDKDELKWRSDKVLKDLSANKTNYFYLGAHLLDIWNTRCYGAHNFDVNNYSGKNFFDYCYVTFGLEKSQVSRYMNIVDEFGDGLRGFKPEYKDYSYSLLSEMLSLSPAERKKVKPDWTIKQIREYKKELSGAVATSQQTAEKVKVTKLYGDLHCSVRNSEYINKFSIKTDCVNLMNPPEALLEDILDFCQSSIVGFSSPGYGIKDKDRINVIYGLIAFALDVGKQIFFSDDKNYYAFWNIFDMVPILRELGYMPGGTND